MLKRRILPLLFVLQCLPLIQCFPLAPPLPPPLFSIGILLLRRTVLFQLWIGTFSSSLADNRPSGSSSLSSSRASPTSHHMSDSSSSMSNSEQQCPVTTKKVLVIGANGKTGFRVIQQLLQLEKQPPNDSTKQQQTHTTSYQPVAMIRDAAQGPRFDALKVPWIVGDLEAGGAPTPQQLEGMDAVLFAAGAGRNRSSLQKVSIDYLGAVRAVVSAQATTSVQRFVLLSGINTDLGGTRRSAQATDLSGPLSAWHRLKAQSEHYLKESHLHGRALDWTIVCPGRLVDDKEEDSANNNDKKSYNVKASFLHGEDDLKASLTPEERVAAVRSLPGSHDGLVERLCISRDNTAATLVALLVDDAYAQLSQTSITIVNGILPVHEALHQLKT